RAAREDRKGSRTDRDTVVSGVRGVRGPAGSGPLEGTERDRGGDRRDDPRRRGGERCAVLHLEQEAEREGVRGGGAIALGDRERLPLVARCDIRRGPEPDQEGARRREL